MEARMVVIPFRRNRGFDSAREMRNLKTHELDQKQMVSGAGIRDGAVGIVPDHHGVEVPKPAGGRLSVDQARPGRLDAHHRRHRPPVSSEQDKIEMNGNNSTTVRAGENL